ncbi:hypothetical protein [Spirosoma luteum]|uniref:hypothetical protein n=1 Tax=Spirosoma luteum TaxID=431553 RepID=UPI000367C23B|nr:hypothetical protein [Spirosoma luteum]
MEAKKDRKKNFANFITNLHEEDTTDVETLEAGPGVLTLKSESEDTVSELTPLSEQEQDNRQELEEIVLAGLDTYLTVGIALDQIRQAKLYRSTHLSFKAYLAERFDVGRQRAYQLMEAAQVVNELMAEVQDNDDNTGVAIVMPKRESHASALADIPKEHRKQVWDAVVEDEKQTGKAITAKKISEKAQAVTGVPLNKKPPKDRKPRGEQELADEFLTDQASLTAAAMGQPREKNKVPDATWLPSEKPTEEVNELNIVDFSGGELDETSVDTITTVVEKSSESNDHLERLRKAFLNAQPADLVIKISARFLQDEQVVEDWQVLRQDKQITDENGVASLTLQEALELGILNDYLAQLS